MGSWQSFIVISTIATMETISTKGVKTFPDSLCSESHSSEHCVDVSNDCSMLAPLCESRYGKEIMHKSCPATCKICTPADDNKSTSGNCENQFENCDSMKPLCDGNAYSERLGPGSLGGKIF